MSTTDRNGLVYYETTDNVTPLQVVLNGISTAVTNAFDSTDRIFRVADVAARDALYTSRGAPLLVFREDAGVLERNGGAGWAVVGGVPSETVEEIAATTGAQTASASIALATAITAAPYNRVIEIDGTINTSGIVAGAVWSGVLTSAGSLITANVADRAQFPILNSAAIGGSVKLYGSVPLAAGATAQPRMWVLFGSGGQITVASPSRLRVRVRRAI